MEDLLKKFDKLNDHKIMNDLLETHIKNKKLLSEWDILNNHEITIDDYLLLKESSTDPNITEENLQLAINLLNIMDRHLVAIEVANDKIINSGGKVDKNIMSHRIKRMEKKHMPTTIINVHMEEGEQLSLEKIIGEENESS